ncbi:MAG: MFS transporter [Oscillospiraceae bacterium]|nr:MFS transporter [Oscillospiraceae bacterium]
MHNFENAKKLTKGKMIAFATGDICGGGAFNIINFLYPGFLVLVVGLPPYFAGIVIMIASLFDAAIDPIIGLFSDKLRVKYKTRRGSMFFSAPIILISLFIMFFPFSNESVMIRGAAALTSYMFFCLALSSFKIPYYSLSTELTEDYTDRGKLMSVRLAFSIVASIICVAVPGIIVDSFEGHTGFMVMSLIFGSIFMVCVLVTALFAKEGIEPPTHTERFVFKDFISPFKVKPFRQYLWMFLTCQITMAAMSALFFFYVEFYFVRDITATGETSMVGFIGAAIMFGMQVVALPFYMMMIKKRGKMFVYTLGSIIWVLSAMILLFMPAGSNAIWLYILAAVMGFGISGPGLIPHAIFPDIVDVGHLQFGDRRPGTFSGVANFFNTLAQAIGVGVVMAIIGAAGFMEREPGAPPILAQPESAQTAIVFIMAFAPLICMSLGIYISCKYKLTKENHTRVLEAIETGNDRKSILKSL